MMPEDLAEQRARGDIHGGRLSLLDLLDGMYVDE